MNMKRIRWRKRCAALVMAFAMVLGSFSGIPVYAGDGDDTTPEESTVVVPDCGYFTDAVMDSDHYISPDSENPVTYTDGYTVYFVYKNQVSNYDPNDAGETDCSLSVSGVDLNRLDESDGYEYTIELGRTDDSGISFVTETTSSTDYTACKLTIPENIEIHNILVDVTYTYANNTTADPVHCWLWTSWLKSGLVKYEGDVDWDSMTRTGSVTQENITKNTGISACDYGNDFFGIATVDESGNTSYADADFSKLSIQKKTADGWEDTDDGTLEHPDGAANGYYRYFFKNDGTYSITYTDGSTVSRVIVNVSPFNSGYVTDPADFGKSYIIPGEYTGQVFYYQGGKSDTFYFVFNTNEGTRYISKDSSGNVILYRYDESEDDNIPATLDGVTVKKDTAHSVGGYEVYKITLTDSYDFGNNLVLRLLNPYVDEEDGQTKTNKNDCYIGIELSDSGLNFSEPDEGDDVNPVYDENSELSKRKYFMVENTSVVYLVTKSDEGDISRYTSVPVIRTLAGTTAGTSAVTIEQNTDSSDADGLYNITFHQAGTYKIVSSDGSYVIAYVNLPNAAYYRSAEITGANLIEETYAYQTGKSNTIYFAFDTYDGTRSIATDSGKVLLYRWDEKEKKNVLATLDGVTVTKDTTQSVTDYEIYKITLDDNYDFTEGFNLRLLSDYVDEEDGQTKTYEDDRYIGIEMDASGLNAIWAQWDDDSQAFSQGGNEPTKLVDVSVKGEAQLYFVTRSGENVTECTAVPTVQTETGANASSFVTIKKETNNVDDTLQNLYVVTFSKTGIYRFAYNSSYVLVRVGMPEAAFYTSTNITADSLLTETYSYKDGAFNLYLAIAQETDGDPVSWSESLANGDGRTNTVALTEYGLTATRVDGTTGYDIYKLSATSGFALTDWMELYIKYTPTDGRDSWMDSRGISLNCQPAAGSLVASWEEPNDEHASHEKIMGVEDKYSWFYLSKAVYNTSTKTYTYIPVTNLSDIKIVKQDSANPLTITETDADKGYYLFRFEYGNLCGNYGIKVGDSYVEIQKDLQIVTAYMKGSTKTSLTESEDHYAFDITKAESDDDRTFYVSFNKNGLGDEYSFYNFYAGNRSEQEVSGTAGEYYYYADSELKDSTEDWATNPITKLTSQDVTVTVETNDNNEVVLKIVVSEDAPANLIFHVGTIISDGEVPDAEHPWMNEKYIIVTRVETKVDAASESLDSSAVDSGNVTITDVPAIADLDLATNLGNENSLKDDEAATAQKVEVSIKTDVINVTVDEDGKVEVAEGATEEEKKVAEEQKTAVETIIEKKNEVLSKNYSAIFLDLSVTATVTKTKTDMVEGNVSVSAGEEVKVPITETSKPFTIKVPIPKAQQDKRGFSIIRYHEDKNGHKVTERLEATVVYGGTDNKTPLYLEFQTDRFSTYALAYREPNEMEKKSLTFENAKWEVTGDNTFTSDGTEKSLDIKITGMPEGCTYTLKGTKATAKGTYTVYVDTVTYTDADGNAQEYAASDVDLPSAIAKGYTWTILDANLTADAAKDDSEVKNPGNGNSNIGNQTGGGNPNSQTQSTNKNDTDKTDDTTETPDPTPSTGDTETQTPSTGNDATQTPSTGNDEAQTPAAGSNTPQTPTTDTTTTDTKTTVKKGTTTKKSGNTYTVTSAKTKTVAFTSVKKNSKTVTIPSKVTINGVSYKVTSVAANAFKNNKKLTKVTIPSSVTKIGASAFSGCAKLTSVTISKNVTTIGKSAFAGCTSLKKITLPSKLTTIGASAFIGCKKLTSVTIPSKVTTIGAKAFYNCSKLSKVTIKSTKIKTIGSKAFTKNAKKPTITVPSKKKTAYKKLLKKAGYTKTVKAAK
jgi:hypothetical protein